MVKKKKEYTAMELHGKNAMMLRLQRKLDKEFEEQQRIWKMGEPKPIKLKTRKEAKKRLKKKSR